MRGARFPKTVLVLGAGASHHLGYPVGSQLLQQIESLSGGSYPHQNKVFQHQLRGAQTSSIDNFLKSHELNEDYQRYAKGLILYSILEAESSDAVFEFRKDDWYTYLVNAVENHMRAGTGSFEDLSIITFNYDRSLEYTLANRVLHRNLARTMKEALKLVGADRVIHMYGRVPMTPDEYLCANDCEYVDAQSVVPEYGMSSHMGQDFGGRMTNCMRLGRTLIKTFFEDSVESARAEAILQEAEHIVFLGFAYHPQNMRALKFNFADRDRCKRKIIAGTSFQMNPTEIALVNNDYNRMIQLFPDTCLDLFKKHFALGTQRPLVGRKSVWDPQ